MKLAEVVASCAVAVLPCLASAAGGMFTPGRVVGRSTNVHLSVTVGVVTEFEGIVQETTRPVDLVLGEPEENKAERFDTDDFNMDGGYTTVGLSLECAGKYFTFQFDTAFMNPDTEAVAKRDYYIGVGEAVDFEGGRYTNMKIPEGSSFEMDIIANVSQFRGLFTPVTFAPTEKFKFTPWIDIGLFLFLGSYDIDAGPPTGTTRYLHYEEDFVVGGESEGFLGAGLPEIGLGGEFRIGGEGEVNLVVQGNYAICEYDGDTGFVTSSRHREKDIDLSHVDARLRCSLEVPLKSGRCLTVGAQYQFVEFDASITAKPTSPEETIERWERFDKDVSFKMVSITGMAGLTF